MRLFVILLTILIISGYVYHEDVKQFVWRLEMNNNIPFEIGD